MLLDGARPFVRNKTPRKRSKTSSLNTPHKPRLPSANLRHSLAQERMGNTLNSFIIGMISSSSASLVTSPPLRSILFPMRITGTLTPSWRKYGSQYVGIRSKELAFSIEYTTHMTWALRISDSKCCLSSGSPVDLLGGQPQNERHQDVHPESTMYVVTFSGVTSGGMVTSGTIC